LAIRHHTYKVIITPTPSQLSLYAFHFPNSRRLQRASNSYYASQISIGEH